MKAMWRVGGMKQISDSQFQVDWLSLREPADHAARDAALLDRAARCVSPGMRVLDLGSGTGSTARAFSSGGFDELQWCFLDNDPALLQIAKAQHPCRVGAIRRTFLPKSWNGSRHEPVNKLLSSAFFGASPQQMEAACLLLKSATTS